MVYHGLDGLRSLPAGACLSIGNFDGMHLGHQRILSTLGTLRERDGGATAVITFEPHPLTALRPEIAPPRLTPMPLKQRLLAAAGVDHLVVLPPTKEVLGVSAEEFWGLVRDTRPRHLVEGPDFNFGRGRGGTIERLIEWSRGTSVEISVAEPVNIALLDLQMVPVSSSLVRWLLSNGRVREAAIALGRAYCLVGQVGRGFQRGRKMDMPTANLNCGEQMVPADGVYAARCAVGGKVYPAAVSIGTLPTFAENTRQIEAHLVGFDGDLYGAELGLELVDWLREQRKFSSVELLMAQMKRDVSRTVALAEMDPARAIARVG